MQKGFLHKNAKITINKIIQTGFWMIYALESAHISQMYVLVIDFTCLTVLLG